MARRRPWWLWIAGGALVVAAAVLATSVAYTDRPTPLPHDGSTADPGTPDPTRDHLAIMLHAPGPAISEEDARGLVSMPWVLFQQRDGGSTLRVVAATGDDSCVKPAGYRLEQTNSYVELWIYSAKAPVGTHCLPLVTEWRTDIPLTRPLGDRILLHARTDPAWPAKRVFDGYVWATP